MQTGDPRPPGAPGRRYHRGIFECGRASPASTWYKLWMRDEWIGDYRMIGVSATRELAVRAVEEMAREAKTRFNKNT